MKQKQYERMKQADRIEYLLLKQNIKWFPISGLFLILGLFLLLSFNSLGILVWQVTKSLVLLEILGGLIPMGKFIFWALFILDVVTLIISFRKLKDLDKRFLN